MEQEAISIPPNEDPPSDTLNYDKCIVTCNRLDPITVLQDTVDSLSISLFEALRTLRDAVAPESAYNQGQPTITEQVDMTDPDYDAFVISVHNRESYALELVAKNDGKLPASKDEYAKLLSKTEMDKDIALVSKLAGEIINQSKSVDTLVSNLKGIDRTKADQMKVIEKLVEDNQVVEKDLDIAFEEAKKIRDEIRIKLQTMTCDPFDIEEEL